MMGDMLPVTISQRRGKFFGRFIGIDGKWCTIELRRAVDLEQASRDGKLLASICQGIRFGLPSIQPAPPTVAAVYFAAARRGAGDVLVKIGFARDVVARLRRLQTGSAGPLVLVAWREGGAAVEREEHERWAAYRERGEWFRLEGELHAHLERLRRRLLPPEDAALSWSNPRVK